MKVLENDHICMKTIARKKQLKGFHADQSVEETDVIMTLYLLSSVVFLFSRKCLLVSFKIFARFLSFTYRNKEKPITYNDIKADL